MASQPEHRPTKELVTLDDQGTVTLLIRDSVSIRPVRCCLGRIKLVSPVFQKMFRPTFAEGLGYRAEGQATVTLEEDGDQGEAMVQLLSMLHSYPVAVTTVCPLRIVAGVVVLADKYVCLKLLLSWVESQCSRHTIDERTEASDLFHLFIAGRACSRPIFRDIITSATPYLSQSSFLEFEEDAMYAHLPTELVDWVKNWIRTRFVFLANVIKEIGDTTLSMENPHDFKVVVYTESCWTCRSARHRTRCSPCPVALRDLEEVAQDRPVTHRQAFQSAIRRFRWMQGRPWVNGTLSRALSQMKELSATIAPRGRCPGHVGEAVARCPVAAGMNGKYSFCRHWTGNIVVPTWLLARNATQQKMGTSAG